MVKVRRIGSAAGERFPITVPSKIPTAPPAQPVRRLSTVFCVVDTIHSYRPREDRYRPSSQVPTAYRPSENLLFSRSFLLDLTDVVDAGDVFPSFPQDS
jgi:hypothetical protein